MSALRSFTDFIFHSRLRAVGVAFAITFIPLIGTISIVIAGLVTLRKGALEGLWILLAATLPCVLMYSFHVLPLWVVFIFVISNILTWVFAIVLNRFDNWNLVLELTALIGIVIVATTHVIKPDIETWWGTQLSSHISQMVPSNEASSNGSILGSTPGSATAASEKNPFYQDGMEELTEPEINNLINNIKPFATGILASYLLLSGLIQLFVARWWQLSLVDPKKLVQETRSIRLTSMAGLVFLAALILSYVKISLAQDMLPVLYLSFCLAGLSLAHYAAGKFHSLAWLFLIVFYSVLLGSWMAYKLPLVFQLVAMAALLDVWFDWRGRLDKRFP